MALKIVKRCLYCGQDFVKRHAKSYCSETCNKAHNNEMRRKRAAERLTKRCEACGCFFVAKRLSSRFCSESCRKYATRAAAPKAVLPILHKLCRHCGTLFDTPNVKRYYCSQECRRAFDNEHKREVRAKNKFKLRPQGWWSVKTYSPWDDVTVENVVGNVLDDSWGAAPIEDWGVISLPERESIENCTAVTGEIQSDTAKPRSENIMDEEKMKNLETTAILFRNAFLKLKEAYRMEREAEAFFTEAVKSGEAAKMFNLAADEGII